MASETTLRNTIAGWGQWGDRLAVSVEREPEAERWPYRRFVHAIHGVAYGLIRSGLNPGETVALVGPPSPSWLVCCFGTILAGGVAVPLDAQHPDDDIAKLLLDGGCARAFTTRARAEKLVDLRSLSAMRLFLLDVDEQGAPSSWSTLLNGNVSALPAVDPSDPAVLFYTSGTTGAPKGVPLSHANLLANVEAMAAEALVGPDDRVLLPLPLHHAYPFTVGVLGALCSGAGLILPASFSGPSLSRALREATVLIGVPRLHAALSQAFTSRMGPWSRRALDVCIRAERGLGLPLGRWILGPLRRAAAPRLRLLVSGGAKLDETIERTLSAMGWQVLTGYGLTETSPMLTFNRPERKRIGSVGQPLRGATIRVFRADESGNGEIQAKGANVFHGYRQRPESTREAFTDDGWFCTGDLGHFDAEGYLYIAGRTKDLIVLPNGEKVLPEEIEEIYEESEIVREVAVLAEGGVLVALVVPDEEALRVGGTVGVEGQLREEFDRLERRLRPFQRAMRIAVARSSLPRTPIGKLQRFRLRDLWQRAAERRREAKPIGIAEPDKTLLADPLAAKAWEWLKARFPDRAFGLDDSPQLDLGIDSLGWIGLTIEIEQRFGRSLNEAAVGRIVTLRDLLRELVDAPPAASVAASVPAAESSNAPWPLLGTLLYLLNRAVMAVCFRLRVEGRSNLPDAGPFLLVPNHASYLDPLAVAAALPRDQWRKIHWAGWTELLFATPLMRAVSRACRVFPVDPKRGGLAAVSTAVDLLRQKQIVVWFPEGGRSPDGALRAFNPGVGLLVARTGVPAVPVRIRGSFEAWPLWRRLPRPRRLVVTIGTPIAFNKSAFSEPEDRSSHDIAERLRHAVAALE